MEVETEHIPFWFLITSTDISKNELAISDQKLQGVDYECWSLSLKTAENESNLSAVQTGIIHFGDDTKVVQCTLFMFL